MKGEWAREIFQDFNTFPQMWDNEFNIPKFPLWELKSYYILNFEDKSVNNKQSKQIRFYLHYWNFSIVNIKNGLHAPFEDSKLKLCIKKKLECKLTI